MAFDPAPTDGGHICSSAPQLDRPFNSTQAVQRVEFLRAGGTNPGTNAAVETAGWGSVDNLGARPDKLKEVVLEVVSSARCKRSDYFGRKFTANMLCAHKVCEDPCSKPFRKEDSCDVSVPAESFWLNRSLWAGPSSSRRLGNRLLCGRATPEGRCSTTASPWASLPMEGRSAAS